MPGLRERLNEAAITLLGRRRYFRATVTRRERANQGRREQYTYAELLQRFQNVVYTAVSRNSQAVAAKQLRVYRKSESAFPQFEGKPITKRRHKYLCESAGRVVRKKIDEQDDVEEITDDLHPLVQLLDKVNQQDNGFDLIEDTVMGLELTGNFYWKPVMGERWPVEIWPLAPQHVRIVPSENDNALIAYFAYGRERDNEQRYLPDEVIHFKYRNPHSPFYGFPPLAACITEADVCTGVAVFAYATLKNGVSGGLVLGSTKTLTPEQAEQIRYEVEGKYAGEIHAGKTIIMEGPLDQVHQIKSMESEFSYIDSDKHFRERVANVYAMPVGILTLENASLAASQESIHQWQVMSIGPKCRKLEDVLNQRLVPMFGDPSLFVAFDNPIDEDEEESANRAVALFSGDIVNKNEARAMVGMDAIEGGDVFASEAKLAQAQALAPFGGFGGFGGGGFGGGLSLDKPGLSFDEGESGLEFNKPMALPAPGGMQFRQWRNDHGMVESTGAATNADVLSNLRRNTGTVSQNGWRGPGVAGNGAGAHTRHGGEVSAGRDAESTAIKQHSLWFTDEWGDCCIKPPRGHTVTKDDRAGRGIVATEDELTRALQAFFRKLQGPIVDAVQNRTAIALSSDANLVQALAAELSQPLGRQFVDAYNATVAAMAGRASMDPIDFTNARAISYMRANPPVLASAVLQGLEEKIGDSLIAGIEAGEGNVDLAERIQGIVGDKYVAERIARTESSHAAGMAKIGAWKDSGIVERTEWLLSSDPCEICQAMFDARPTVPLGDPFIAVGESILLPSGKTFTASFRDVVVPPLHPQCRCREGAIFK